MYRVSGVVLILLFAVCVSGTLVAQSDAPTAPPDKALVIVRVQADAIVSIDGQATSQKGAERRYLTPALEPGSAYVFEVVARWKENGQEQSARRTVDFKAGQVKIVDLTRPDPPAKKAEPARKKDPQKKNEPAEKKAEPEKKQEPPVKKAEPEKKTEPPTKNAAPEKKQEAEKKIEPMPPPTREVRTRSFLFTYAARIRDLPPGTVARIWIPMAVSNAHQQVTIVQKYLGSPEINRDAVYGNTIAYFEGKANTDWVIPFEVTYKVQRREVHAEPAHGVYIPLADGEPLQRFLRPDARVPIAGKPLELLQAHLQNAPLPSEPVVAARTMYDAVNKHLKYSPAGPGIGEGDAVAACASRLGNCTDFHSLFIAMARGCRMPAKFEIGFALPAKPGPVADGHCWAWFGAGGKGWVPVDISQANRHPEQADYCFGNLDENRISFSVGRDIDLVPRQNGPPLNFFIDPYVEVNGKAYPQAKIQRRHAFKELATK